MVKIVKLFLICTVALAATTFARERNEWIEQKLDHFNKSDTRTWKMGYFASDDFYIQGGPLFIYISGDRFTSQSFIEDGLFFDTAREHYAYLFQTEHRFFGKSRPVENFTTESLKYLNVQQALADLAHFVRTIKSSSLNLNDAKVIMGGEFYAGSLAVWFKKLYPDLADGVWASGAPLLAKLDFKEYAEAVGNKIRVFGGDSCYNRIANGINILEQLLAENRSAELKTVLNICDTFDASNELDVAVLFDNLIHAIYRMSKSIDSIKGFCEEVIYNDFKSFSNFLAYPFNKKLCKNISYKNKLAKAKDMTFSSSNAYPWLYQSCNELGWFSTTSSTQQPFGSKLPLSFFIKFCKDLFGDKFTLEYMESQINKTNQLFGGLNPQVENVYLTYGAFDSRLPLGIQDVNKKTVIPMDSVKLGTQPSSNINMKELIAVKSKFTKLFEKWVRQYYE